MGEVMVGVVSVVLLEIQSNSSHSRAILTVVAIHKQCISNAQTMHKQCTNNAQTMHKQCTSNAQAMHKQGTSNAQAMHKQCTNNAQAMHKRLDIQFNFQFLLNKNRLILLSLLNQLSPPINTSTSFDRC